MRYFTMISQIFEFVNRVLRIHRNLPIDSHLYQSELISLTSDFMGFNLIYWSPVADEEISRFPWQLRQDWGINAQVAGGTGGWIGD